MSKSNSKIIKVKQQDLSMKQRKDFFKNKSLSFQTEKSFKLKVGENQPMCANH